MLQPLVRDGLLIKIGRVIERRPALLNLETNAGNPVYWATMYSRYEVLKWLLDKGAKPNQNNDHKKHSALQHACDVGNLRMVSLLIEKGADPLTTSPPVLSTAARNGYMHLMTYLVKTVGVGINARHQDGSGWTALHCAASFGQCQSIEFLLSYGADPTLCDKEGKTAHELVKTKIEKKGYCDFMEKKCLFLLEDAMAEPDRIQLLHKARVINDTLHAVQSVENNEHVVTNVVPPPPFTSLTTTAAATAAGSSKEKEAAGEKEKEPPTAAATTTALPLSQQDKRILRCVSVTPPCLKGRVTREEALPIVDIAGSSNTSNEAFSLNNNNNSISEEEDDSSSSSCSSLSSLGMVGSPPVSATYNSGVGSSPPVSPTYGNAALRLRRNSRSTSMCSIEDDPFTLEVRQAVIAHVATGGLFKELMIELNDMMLPNWAPTRKG